MAALDARVAALIDALGDDYQLLFGRDIWCPAMTMQGAQVVRTGTVELPIPAGNWKINSVTIRVSTAPTGSALTVDVNKNGTTIFTTQGNRPSISAGSKTNTSAAPNVNTLAAGDYLTVDVDAIGSTVPGSDLVVIINLSRVS
jgi:hypothetical protein